MNTDSTEHKHYWKVHLQQSHPKAMVEAGGETTPEEEEEVIPEEDEEEILQMLLVEERIKIKVSQVARGLINQNSMSLL